MYHRVRTLKLLKFFLAGKYIVLEGLEVTITAIQGLRNLEWTDFIRMISRSPRDNSDAHGAIIAPTRTILNETEQRTVYAHNDYRMHDVWLR